MSEIFFWKMTFNYLMVLFLNLLPNISSTIVYCSPLPVAFLMSDLMDYMKLYTDISLYLNAEMRWFVFEDDVSLRVFTERSEGYDILEML